MWLPPSILFHNSLPSTHHMPVSLPPIPMSDREICTGTTLQAGSIKLSEAKHTSLLSLLPLRRFPMTRFHKRRLINNGCQNINRGISGAFPSRKISRGGVVAPYTTVNYIAMYPSHHSLPPPPPLPSPNSSTTSTGETLSNPAGRFGMTPDGGSIRSALYRGGGSIFMHMYLSPRHLHTPMLFADSPIRFSSSPAYANRHVPYGHHFALFAGRKRESSKEFYYV